MQDVIAIPERLLPDQLASVVADFWTENSPDRQVALDNSMELRNYLTAATTAGTEVGNLPWKNKTTIPKLTQIYNNLISYYTAALMPNDSWFIWEGSNEDSQKKAEVIQEYMMAKMRESGFASFIIEALADWLLFGFAFGGADWVENERYTGPKAFRISPIDGMINTRSVSFDSSPFIRRSIQHISRVLDNPAFDKKALSKIQEVRSGANYDYSQFYKEDAIAVDGYNTHDRYFDSGEIELLEYYGPLFDPEKEKYLGKQHVVVADRAYVLLREEIPITSMSKPVVFSSWRKMPENLLSNGPLHQLVGMQYRCDHLENLKSDGFDMIIHPMIKVKGDQVEEFEYGPGQRIHCGGESDVEFLSPDTNILLCDNQIDRYHRWMEEFAGSPRESMGFRTPGEKTAFEVNVLQQGADRLFLNKAHLFEDNFIQPLLQIMLELIIENMPVEDVVRVYNDTEKSTTFFTVRKEDIQATGTLRPVGAKYYEQRNRRVSELQNLTQLMQTYPAMANHYSGFRSAQMFEEELGFTEFDLVEKNIGVTEAAESQILLQQIQQSAEALNGTDEDAMAEPGGFEGE